MEKKLDQLMHLLVAVHMQGEEFYLSQIDEIIECYGYELVSSAEKALCETRLFSLCLVN